MITTIWVVFVGEQYDSYYFATIFNKKIFLLLWGGDALTFFACILKQIHGSTIEKSTNNSNI
jgi:hypothetical protein